MTYLLGRPVTLANITTIVEQGEDLLDGGLFFPELLHLQTLASSSGQLLLVLKSLLNELNVLDSELFADNVQISDWVDITLDVDNLGIVEASHDLEDGIDGTDVGQESVSETSTSRGASGQTGNIVDSEMCGDSGLRVVLLAEPVESLIRHKDTRLFGFDGCVGEVLPRISDTLRLRTLGSNCSLRRGYQENTL